MGGMHANGVVHRDISLENVLLHGDNTVRVVDFGQAVPVWDTLTGRVKMHRGRASKAYYRAPEMYTGEYQGPPIDMFALGVLLFIMAVGTPPWDNATRTDQRFRYIQDHSVGAILNAWGMGALLSAPCIDMLDNLLKELPGQRLTADGAKQHVWFRNSGIQFQSRM